MARDFNSFKAVARFVEEPKTFPGKNGKEGYLQVRMVTTSQEGYGEKPKKDLWFTAFFRQSQIEKVYQYFTKGKPIIVSGRLTQDEFTTQTGEARTGLTLDVKDWEFLPSGPRTGEAEQTSSDSLPF